MNIRPLLFACLAWACFPNPTMADGVYLATGEYGEASFSDFALPDAVSVHIEVHEPSAREADVVRGRLAETIAMAAELESARRERESVYAERRAEAARRMARNTRQVAKAEVPGYDEPAYGRLGSSYPGGYFHNGRPRLHPGRHAGGRHRDPWKPMTPEPVQPPAAGRALKWPSRRTGR